MAKQSVPLLAFFSEDARVEQVAHRRRISYDEVYQLPFDEVMRTMARMHLESVYAYNAQENQKREDKLRK